MYRPVCFKHFFNRIYLEAFKNFQIHVEIRVLRYVMQRITTYLAPAITRFSIYLCVRRYDKCLNKFLETA